MRNIIVTLIFLLALTNSFPAQTQNIQWARAGLSWGYDNGRHICTDKFNNIYCTGDFGFNFQQFPSAYIIFNNDTAYNKGDNQIFLVKYSPKGDVIWAKGIGGMNYTNPFGGVTEQPGQIVYDSLSESLYLSGSFAGYTTFGDTTIYGSYDVFVARLDLDGNFDWVKVISSESSIFCAWLTHDAKGNIFVAGGAQDTFSIENKKFPPGKFLVKFDTSGQVNEAGTRFSNVGLTGILCKNDAVYVSGFTVSKTARLDTVEFSSTYPINSFVLKYNCNLQMQQLQVVAKSSNWDWVSFFRIDNDGNFIFSGSYSETLYFDTLVLPSSGGHSDAFIAKTSPSGKLLWFQKIASLSNVSPADLSIDSRNNYIITGNFNGRSDFAGSIIEGNGLFAAGFNANGECLGARNVGNIYEISGGIDNLDNIFVTGEYQGNETVGDTTLPSYNGTPNVFLVKLAPFPGLGKMHQKAHNKLFIYSNPTNGICNIEIPEEFAHEPLLSLFVYDQQGRLLKQAEITMEEEQVQINLEALAKGMYTAILTNGKSQYNGKIILQ
jgi:hypothetical protein